MELCPCLCVMVEQDRRKSIFSTAEEPHPGIRFRITLRLIPRRVQDVERAERAERRAERREEMMDEADAIKRAYGDRKIYIIR